MLQRLQCGQKASESFLILLAPISCIAEFLSERWAGELRGYDTLVDVVEQAWSDPNKHGFRFDQLSFLQVRIY